MKKILLLAMAIFVTGCTDEGAARKALEGAGYTDIEVGGYAFFICSDKDAFATKFRANGPTGKPVTGAVCAGFLKGNTIRTD